jgi:hypothetical protein
MGKSTRGNMGKGRAGFCAPVDRVDQGDEQHDVVEPGRVGVPRWAGILDQGGLPGAVVVVTPVAWTLRWGACFWLRNVPEMSRKKVLFVCEARSI